MQSFAKRFATTGPLAELRNIQNEAEDGESSDAMWGSEAGFGNVAHGVPTFSVPAVPDVIISIHSSLLI